MFNICKFIFNKGIDANLIKAQIAIAVIAAESTLGQEKVRLYAAYDSFGRTVIIDVSSDVGEHIAQVFTGLMRRQVGEDKFKVERLSGKERA